MMGLRLGALSFAGLALLVIGGCTTVSPSPVNTPAPSPGPSASAAETTLIFCDGFPPPASLDNLHGLCTGVAAEAIALLPTPHPSIVSVRLVYTPPTGHVLSFGPTITAGFTFRGQPHVVGHSYRVENGALVSTGSL